MPKRRPRPRVSERKRARAAALGRKVRPTGWERREHAKVMEEKLGVQRLSTALAPPGRKFAKSEVVSRHRVVRRQPVQGPQIGTIKVEKRDRWGRVTETFTKPVYSEIASRPVAKKLSKSSGKKSGGSRGRGAKRKAGGVTRAGTSKSGKKRLGGTRGKRVGGSQKKKKKQKKK